MDLDFDVDFDDAVERDVRSYVRQVSKGLGLRGDSSSVDSAPHAGAYLAVEGRLPAFPRHDVALLWDEQTGWSAAIEDANGALVIVARLEDDLRPSPVAVVRWARRLFRGDSVSQLRDENGVNHRGGPAVAALADARR